MGLGFLKTVGKVVATSANIAFGVGPILSQEIPQSGKVVTKVSSELQDIAGVVEQAEVMAAAIGAGLTGPQKLQAVTPLVTQIVLRSSLISNKKIENPTLFQEGVQDITNGIVKILNSLESQ